MRPWKRAMMNRWLYSKLDRHDTTKGTALAFICVLGVWGDQKAWDTDREDRVVHKKELAI